MRYCMDEIYLKFSTFYDKILTCYKLKPEKPMTKNLRLPRNVNYTWSDFRWIFKFMGWANLYPPK